MIALSEAAQALREAAVVRVSVLSAYKPGDVVIVECTKPYSPEAIECVRRYVQGILERTGIEIILLADGMRVVGREEHTTVPPT